MYTSKYDVFISYSRKDLEIVKRIKGEIERLTGVGCWMDLDGISADEEDYLNRIVEGIERCKVFIFMLSNSSQKSEHAVGELVAARKQKKETGIHVVILNVDGCEMNKKFIIRFSQVNSILWSDPPQKENLIRCLKIWLAKDKNESSNSVELFAVKRDGKYGYVDVNGNIVIPFKWKYAWDFSEGLAYVQNDDNKFGFINNKGEVVIPFQWKEAMIFSEGLAPVKGDNDKWGFINKDGDLIIPYVWDDAMWFCEGLARVQDDENYGYIDKMGNIVIPCQWKEADAFSETLALVRNDQDRFGFINKQGGVEIPCVWNDALDFSEGLAAVQDANGKWGYINKLGEVVIACQWKYAESFKYGLAAITNDEDKSAYIDKTGNFQI